MKKRSSAIALAAILMAVTAWNFPLTYRIGIDGNLYVKKIPLYAKVSGFLYRDWMYKDIAKEITAGCKTDEERVLAILRWTVEHVKRGIPAGLKALDDHPLNIIIRQYGQEDQLDDIFTILCSYAGMYGCKEKCYGRDRAGYIVLSFISMSDGRRLIFDASNNKYFLNDKGGIASVDDYMRGRLILSKEDDGAYGEYLKDVEHIDFSGLTRAGEQMPLKRIPIEFMKLFRDKSGRN